MNRRAAAPLSRPVGDGVGRFVSTIRWAEAPADRITIGLAIAAAALVVLGPLLALPGLYLSAMPHDSLSMADIGYRMNAGQSPGRDFHSAFGVLFQWQMALAMRLGGTVSWTLKLATLEFMLFAAPFAAHIARTRLSNLGTVAVVFSALVLGGAPYAKADQAIEGVTYAMIYNREAWTLLLLAVLFWLSPRRRADARVDAAMLGALVAALLYTKVSYGGLALVFAAAWFALRTPRRDVLATLAGVLLAATALTELANGQGYNFAYLSDILFAARAGGGRLGHIVLGIYGARYELAVVCVLAPLALPEARRPRRIDYMFLLCVAAASLLIVWQNAQVEGLVLLWAGMASLLEPVIADPPPRSPGQTWPFAATAAAIYATWAVLTVGPSALAMAEYVHGVLSVKAQDPGIPMIADVRFATAKPGAALSGGVDGAAYAADLRDGVALLAACPRRASIFTVDLFEPFSMLTGRPSNRGWTWHDPHHSFTRQFYPTADAELSGVGCVMVPRHPTKPASTEDMLAVYGDDLRARFPKTVDSAGWTLRLAGPLSSGGR